MFILQGGFIGTTEKRSTFKIDLTDKEYVEYDEKSQESVAVYKPEGKFERTK